MIKLIALDLDGTLLEKDHVTISERNQKALRAISEKGIKIAFVSGRTFSIMKPVIEQAGCADYAVISNGVEILDAKTEEALYRNTGILPEKAYEIMKAASDYPVGYEVYCEHNIVVSEKLARRFEAARKKMPKKFFEFIMNQAVVVSDIEAYLEGKTLEKINISGIPAECREQLFQRMEAIKDLKLTYSLSDNLELNHKDTNKGTALRKLAEIEGVSLEEIMAFGDSKNDMDMLKMAGQSYAMGNASEEVKAIAKYVTCSNIEDGVAAVLEKL